MLTICDCVELCKVRPGKTSVTIVKALQGSKLALLQFRLDAPDERLHLTGTRLLGLGCRFEDLSDFERELWSGGNVWVR